jgi:hypothetical protein
VIEPIKNISQHGELAPVTAVQRRRPRDDEQPESEQEQREQPQGRPPRGPDDPERLIDVEA